MTEAITEAERQRFRDARERVVNCINEMVDDGFSSEEIYVALAGSAVVILIEGVPDVEHRSSFVRVFMDQAMQKDLAS